MPENAGNHAPGMGKGSSELLGARIRMRSMQQFISDYAAVYSFICDYAVISCLSPGCASEDGGRSDRRSRWDNRSGGRDPKGGTPMKLSLASKPARECLQRPKL